MSDSYIQVPPNGTGLKIDTTELPVGANTVERQRTNLTDPTDAAGIAKVITSAPAGTEYGVVVREAQMGSDGASAPSVASGGSGVRGWLASIAKLLGGILQVAVQGSGTLYCNAVAANTTAAPLSGSQAVSEVLVQNDPGSGGNLLVGNATTQAINLAPGAAITVPASNLSLVYVKMASGTGTANYLGRS